MNRSLAATAVLRPHGDPTLGTAADVALAYQTGTDHLFASTHKDWHIA